LILKCLLDIKFDPNTVPCFGDPDSEVVVVAETVRTARDVKVEVEE
jgi:hypothetical protein